MQQSCGVTANLAWRNGCEPEEKPSRRRKQWLAAAAAASRPAAALPKRCGVSRHVAAWLAETDSGWLRKYWLTRLAWLVRGYACAKRSLMQSAVWRGRRRGYGSTVSAFSSRKSIQ